MLRIDHESKATLVTVHSDLLDLINVTDIYVAFIFNVVFSIVYFLMQLLILLCQITLLDQF